MESEIYFVTTDSLDGDLSATRPRIERIWKRSQARLQSFQGTKFKPKINTEAINGQEKTAS